MLMMGIVWIILVAIMIYEYRKRVTAVQAKLSDRTSQLEMTTNNLPVILFALDEQGIFTLSSGHGLHVLHLQPSEVVGQSVYDVYHDHPEVLAHISRAMEHTTLNTIFNEKITIGEATFSISYSRYTTDKSGQSTLVGIALDVTEQLLMEKNLRLTDAVFSTADPMLISDASGVIVRVNEAFCTVTGFEPEEIIGQNLRYFQTELHDVHFYQQLWDTLQKHGHWQGELWSTRKSGEIYPQWVTIRGVHDHDNILVNYVGAFFDLSTQKKMEAQVQVLSRIDTLTGLLNRAAILEQLSMTLEKANSSSLSGAYVVLDVDRFKDINDALGHVAGDMLLNVIAKRLEQNVLATATVARFGADEFAVILPELACQKEHSQCLRRITNVLQEMLTADFEFGDQSYAFTISIGATLFSAPTKSLETIVQEADIALHVAKQNGKNTMVCFEQDMAEARESSFRLTEDLRHALSRHELTLYLQPQVDATGHMHGVESLLRWIYRGDTVIGPDQFIPIAEESGLIIPIGTWVLKQSCQLLKTIQNDEHPLSISVNVSPKQFYEDNFVDVVLSTIHEAGIDPHYLTLEVTEGLLMQHIDSTVQKLIQLSRLGIQFSIDDFGTGYSSLAYLKDLPVHELKIDKVFVANMMHDTDSAMIVDTIIGMARHLGLAVIAEGVETQEQLTRLTSMGCHHFQGYFFSRPIPEAQFILGVR